LLNCQVTDLSHRNSKDCKIVVGDTRIARQGSSAT